MGKDKTEKEINFKKIKSTHVNLINLSPKIWDRDNPTKKKWWTNYKVQGPINQC
jgi:hypothetical protein